VLQLAAVFQHLPAAVLRARVTSASKPARKPHRA
jgi:hypothetical protein